MEAWDARLPEDGLIIGVSDKANLTDSSSYRRSYEQAMMMLNVCRKSGRSIVGWRQAGIEKVAAFLEEQDLFKGFADDLLAPLIEYDQSKRTELVQTLGAYLENFFNLKKTGEVLFVHPNTVKYRMETVRALLKIEVEDASNYALLILAYRSYFKHV